MLAILLLSFALSCLARPTLFSDMEYRQPTISTDKKCQFPAFDELPSRLAPEPFYISTPTYGICSQDLVYGSLFHSSLSPQFLVEVPLSHRRYERLLSECLLGTHLPLNQSTYDSKSAFQMIRFYLALLLQAPYVRTYQELVDSGIWFPEYGNEFYFDAPSPDFTSPAPWQCGISKHPNPAVPLQATRLGTLLLHLAPLRSKYLSSSAPDFLTVVDKMLDAIRLEPRGTTTLADLYLVYMLYGYRALWGLSSALAEKAAETYILKVPLTI